ncbi:MAG TPA: bifunctional diguanylate cyclase/phosphodiesterase [Solirubrobacteraceae bacterium]
MPQRSAHQLVEFLTAVSAHERADGATAAAAELAAQHLDAEIGAVLVGDALAAATGFGAVGLVHAHDDEVDLPGLGRCWVARAEWDADRRARLVVARRGTPFDADERMSLMGMARILELALHGVAAVGAEQMLRERHRLLEVLLDIQRSISHRKPLPDVLCAITSGASGLLGGCPVALVLDDPLDPERPIVAATTAGGERSETELAIVATAAARTATTPSADGALAASVHINGARAGALVAMAAGGFDDAQLGMLDAFAEHASLALTDARTVEAMEEAFHDSLTGLPNRALFLDRLQHALDVAARRETELCVLFVDLDRFKAVNDSIGHAAGDELLRAVAERLSVCTRAADTAARFGGDEFAVLLEDDGRGVQPDAVAERIIAAMRRPFDVEGKEIFIGATVGIAHARDASPGADELLRNADLAMYRAKKAGGNRAATYETAMRTALLARIELEADLRHALARDELRLVYQPVVELESGRTVGVEALARWAHPTRGMIPPLTFIPVAEEIGVIGAIGRWVLREACRQLAAWRLLAPGLVLNVNLSPVQLRDDRFAADVEQALRANDLPGQALTLEITESMLLSGDEGTAAHLRRLKALGLSIAVDDFGTGYSSLSYLKQFPVDALKIDKSFVDTVARSTADSTLARTIVELGRGMRLETIAEGIETVEQLERLRMLDCELGQGYHFSVPLDGDALTAYLEHTLETQRRAA